MSRRLTAIVGRGRGHDGIEYGAVCCEPVLLIPIRPLRGSSSRNRLQCMPGGTYGNSDEERRFMYRIDQSHLEVFCIIIICPRSPVGLLTSQDYSPQSYEIKSPPWTILWLRILGIFSVENIGGFQLLDLIIPELKSHVIPYKFKSSHWLKLQHSDWRANLVKDFFLQMNFPPLRALEFIRDHTTFKLRYNQI